MNRRTYRAEMDAVSFRPDFQERTVARLTALAREKENAPMKKFNMRTGLIAAARRCGADFAVDVYPHYGSDVEDTLIAGWDVRHGLIGPGVYASHGYERSHVKGAENTLKLLEAYLSE